MSNTKSFLLEYIQNELKPQIEKEVSLILKEQEEDSMETRTIDGVEYTNLPQKGRPRPELAKPNKFQIENFAAVIENTIRDYWEKNAKSRIPALLKRADFKDNDTTLDNKPDLGDASLGPDEINRFIFKIKNDKKFRDLTRVLLTRYSNSQRGLPAYAEILLNRIARTMRMTSSDEIGGYNRDNWRKIYSDVLEVVHEREVKNDRRWRYGDFLLRISAALRERLAARLAEKTDRWLYTLSQFTGGDPKKEVPAKINPLAVASNMPPVVSADEETPSQQAAPSDRPAGTNVAEPKKMKPYQRAGAITKTLNVSKVSTIQKVLRGYFDPKSRTFGTLKEQTSAEPDGIWGEETYKAVLDFQKDVKELIRQGKINDANLKLPSNKPLEEFQVDGIFGEDTKAAFMAVRRAELMPSGQRVKVTRDDQGSVETEPVMPPPKADTKKQAEKDEEEDQPAEEVRRSESKAYNYNYLEKLINEEMDKILG